MAAGAMAAGERAAVASATRLAGGGEGDSPRQRPSVPPAVLPAAAPTAIAVPTPTPLGAPGAIGTPWAPWAIGAIGAMGAMGFRLVLSPPAAHAAAPPRRDPALPRGGTAVEPRHAPLWQPWVLRDVVLGEVDDCR